MPCYLSLYTDTSLPIHHLTFSSHAQTISIYQLSPRPTLNQHPVVFSTSQAQLYPSTLRRASISSSFSRFSPDAVYPPLSQARFRFHKPLLSAHKPYKFYLLYAEKPLLPSEFVRVH